MEDVLIAYSRLYFLVPRKNLFKPFWRMLKSSNHFFNLSRVNKAGGYGRPTCKVGLNRQKYLHTRSAESYTKLREDSVN